MKNTVRIASFLAIALASGTQAFAQTVNVPIESNSFTLTYNQRTAIKGHPEPQFAEHLGRPSLYVPHGIATVRGVDFQDGTIEADLSTKTDGVFLGVAFRVESTNNYELIYFRPFSSGTVEAVQYTPALNGAIAWQLMPGQDAKAAADVPQDKWFHVRIQVEGLTAKLFLNDNTTPSLVVPNLKRGDTHGSIGFWGLFRGGYISNLKFTPAARRDRTLESETKVEEGFLTDWQLSSAYEVKDTDPETYPSGALRWQSVIAEPPGYVLVNRYRESPEIMPTPSREQMLTRFPGSRVVFAKTIINSRTGGERKMWFGYSDEVVVYLNGKRLFGGKNAWRFREPEALGNFGLNDSLTLPLKQGQNELVLAVTEYMGGWAFGCKLDPPATHASPAKSLK
jgi:hypothetical protein